MIGYSSSLTWICELVPSELPDISVYIEIYIEMSEMWTQWTVIDDFFAVW